MKDEIVICAHEIKKPLLLVPVPIRLDNPADRLMMKKPVAMGFMVSQEYCEACGLQFDVIKNGEKIELLQRAGE